MFPTQLALGQAATLHGRTSPCRPGHSRQARVPSVLAGQAIRKQAMKPAPRGKVPVRSHRTLSNPCAATGGAANAEHATNATDACTKA